MKCYQLLEQVGHIVTTELRRVKDNFPEDYATYKLAKNKLFLF
jgi:hypothetical protein